MLNIETRIAAAFTKGAQNGLMDRIGNVHGCRERAQFMDWFADAREAHGADVANWPAAMVNEYNRRYVPSTRRAN